METDTSVVDKFGALLKADRKSDRGTLERTWLDVQRLIYEHQDDRAVLIKVLEPLQEYQELAKSILRNEYRIQRMGTDGALTLRGMYEVMERGLIENVKFVKGKVEWFEKEQRYEEWSEQQQDREKYGPPKFGNGNKKNLKQREGGNLGICQRCNKSILVTAGV